MNVICFQLSATELWTKYQGELHANTTHRANRFDDRMTLALINVELKLIELSSNSFQEVSRMSSIIIMNTKDLTYEIIVKKLTTRHVNFGLTHNMNKNHEVVQSIKKDKNVYTCHHSWKSPYLEILGQRSGSFQFFQQNEQHLSSDVNRPERQKQRSLWY